MSDGLWVVSCTFDGFGEDGDSTDGGLQLVRDIGDEVSAGLGQPDMSAFNVVLLANDQVAAVCVRTAGGLSPGNSTVIPVRALLQFAPLLFSVQTPVDLLQVFVDIL